MKKKRGDSFRKRIGAATMDIAVKMIIGVICGTLVLGSLFFIIKDTALAKTDSAMTEMLNFDGSQSSPLSSGSSSGPNNETPGEISVSLLSNYILVGEVLSPSDITVTSKRSDGSTTQITDFQIDKTSFSQAGSNSLKITAGSMSKSVALNVIGSNAAPGTVFATSNEAADALIAQGLASSSYSINVAPEITRSSIMDCVKEKSLGSFSFLNYGNLFVQYEATAAGNAIVTFTTTPWYYGYSSEQVTAVQTASNEILSSLNLEGKSDYEKFSAIYGWITANVEYDSAGVHNINYNQTLYAALVDKLCVCGGYSNAVYHLSTMAGLECYQIVGTVQGGVSHAWNAIKINNTWYLCDATGDHNRMTYFYFLKGKNNIFFADRTYSVSALIPISDTDY